jgi:hypothetical protein
MSSGIKRCAFGRQCFIAELHAGDRSRDDWTEIQEFGYWGKCLIMQCGETTCCQRRSGRADDEEGNDLLLNSERGHEQKNGSLGCIYKDDIFSTTNTMKPTNKKLAGLETRYRAAL